MNDLGDSTAPRPEKSTPRPRLKLPRDQRLGSKRVIDNLFRTGRRRTHQPIMACMLRRSDNALMRIAISVSKKCGGAVERNAMRRRIREAHRQMQHELPPGMDVLLVVRPHRRLQPVKYQEILRSLLLR